MPNREPVVIGGQSYAVRHVGPRAGVWPQSPEPDTAVLGQPQMVARPLPMSNAPASPDFVSGSWTGRLGDSGECSLTFPNTIASDGMPWRQRFDPAGHNQFVEVYYNGELDFVGVIDTVTPDQQKVTVHCQDGWFLLKKAYERDWVVTQAPRDVIERGTQVWVPVLVDNFPAGSLNPQWNTVASPGSSTIAISHSGGLVMTLLASASPNAQLLNATNPLPPANTTVWSASCYVQTSNIGASQLILSIFEAGLAAYQLVLQLGQATLDNMSQTTIPEAPSYALLLESDGEWVYAFVNGALVGCERRTSGSNTGLNTEVELLSTGTAASVTITGFLLRTQQPFLQPGPDKGDYVLPGVASTYPNGGLHARYFNDTDLQDDFNRLAKILAPTRSQAYGGTAAEYANQQDATINRQANPTPGAASSNWSAIWFGAIWLPLATIGDIRLAFYNPAGAYAGNTALRVWIGKTKYGDQLVDSWTWSSNWDFIPTVSAAALAGTLPYGAGTQQRDGWYPIKIEYAVDSTSGGIAPQMLFQSGAAGTWTDPGGTLIDARTSNVVVPATSLSPLGCVDQRYQGASHYDLVQQTAQAYGYQAAVEPKQLETGQFPGVLAPRIREGHDTDIILTPDTTIRQDGEGILSYSATLDATDAVASIQGNGAGFQNGSTGQLQAEVYDPATLRASLFDAQGWQDFPDASFTSLLQALLNSNLSLRLQPWQLLSADPTGRPRLAHTWPLAATLAAMRWRPGDGLRIQARDINVNDLTPRQMLTITRSITPDGITGTQANFANRPRNPAHALRQQLYAATRPQRNYQRQLVTLPGNFVQALSLAAGATSSGSGVALLPSDQIIGARVRILTVNTAGAGFNLIISGTDVTFALNGPWSTGPVNLDVSAVATSDASGRIYAAVQNNSAGAVTEVDVQLFVDVLR